jgi:hypothetical protein
MTTTGAWSTIASEYGSRVNLVVFDLTNEETTRASRAEAVRLGLERFFDEAGGTGSVVVLDSRTKDITAWIDGSRDLAEYRSAIDDALAGSKTPSGS